MKLMVAGCSYSAPSRSMPGTSWSENLARLLGDWELVNLARQGCSNGGIRIQMDEIRRQRPDFAVVGPTFWDRMEIPATAAPFKWDHSKVQQSIGWNPPLQKHLQDRSIGNGYRREDGIRNVNYGDAPSNMICETIFSLAENLEHPYRNADVSQEAQEGVRRYIDAIYDNAWKKQMDEWIIREGVMMMYLEGIKFLILPNLLWPFDEKNADQWRDAFPAMIPDHYINLDPAKSPQAFGGSYEVDSFNDPGYHTTPEGQQAIAEYFHQHIVKNFTF